MNAPAPPAAAAEPLPTLLVPPAPPLVTVGALLSRTVALWWRNALPFGLLMLAGALPGAAASGAMTASAFGQAGDPAAATRVGGAVMLGSLVSGALQLVGMTGITHAAVRQLEGRRVGLRELLGAGVRRALPVAAIGLVTWLGVAVGLILLVVPGVVAACTWSIAAPVGVVERRGVLGAFGRSHALTRGHRWTILATMLVLFFGVWLLLTLVSTLLLAAVVALAPPSPRVAMLPVVLMQLVSPFLASLPIVTAAVAYHDLRALRDGGGAGELAAVFS